MLMLAASVEIVSGKFWKKPVNDLHVVHTFNVPVIRLNFLEHKMLNKCLFYCLTKSYLSETHVNTSFVIACWMFVFVCLFVERILFFFSELLFSNGHHIK